MGTTLEKLQAVQNSKDAIKAALEDKGLSPSDVFSTYSGLISELENTSDATATSESILEGETAYTAEGLTTGTAVGGIPIVTTAGSGSAYTATVSNFSSLVAGKKITIIPHTTSTAAAPTLNVNSLGAKYIRQRLSTTTATTVAGQSASWLVANKPITVMYDGTYWVAEIVRPDANTFYGTLDIDQGGTGATTAEAALENLGAVGKADIVDNLLSTSTDAPLSANQGYVLNEKVSKKHRISKKTVSFTASLAAGETKSITVNAAPDDTTLTPLGIGGVVTNMSEVLVVGFYLNSSNKAIIILYNRGSTTLNVSNGYVFVTYYGS